MARTKSPSQNDHEYYIWEDYLADGGKEAVFGTAPAEVAAGRVRFDAGVKITSPVADVFRMAMPVKLSGKTLTDNLLTYAQWALICSNKLKTLMERIGVDNIDWYPLVLDNEATGAQVNGYFIGNIVGTVDCVDWSKAVIDDDEAFFGRLWIDPARAKGHRMFRLAGYEHHVVVDRTVKEAVERESISGLAVRPANGYRDEGFEGEDEDEDAE